VHLRRRTAVDPSQLTGIDTVLVSHAHYDHLDLRSLWRVGRDVPIIVPRGVGNLLRRTGFRRVRELAVDDEVAVGALTIRAVPAVHGGKRLPFVLHAEAIGYVVTGSSSIYFAGDTDLFDGMAGLAPGLDVALVPVWGWGATLGRGKHLDPERAAEAVRLLQPRLALPIHWGTFHPVHHGVRRAPAFVTEPGTAFAREVARVAPGVEVRVLTPGASLPLPA
jgi:L-ascorbate metabolism protein UlaG (beta-lactamase superfamily)